MLIKTSPVHTLMAFFAATLLSLSGCTSPRVPDFGAIEIPAERKQAFFEYMAPLVEAKNKQITGDRAALEKLLGHLHEGKLTWWQRGQALDLADAYGLSEVTGGVSDTALLDTLNRRIGVVPAPLALIQAAKESGWGTSRFALEGYNYFGQQCFKEGCGVTPKNRRQGHQHEVARYASPAQSIAAYITNLNTHRRYADFRSRRLTMTEAEQNLNTVESSLTLAATLQAYSERGGAYIKDIQSMLRQNRSFFEP